MRLVPVLVLGLAVELVMVLALAYSGPCGQRQVYLGDEGTCLPRNVLVPAR